MLHQEAIEPIVGSEAKNFLIQCLLRRHVENTLLYDSSDTVRAIFSLHAIAFDPLKSFEARISSCNF